MSSRPPTRSTRGVRLLRGVMPGTRGAGPRAEAASASRRKPGRATPPNVSGQGPLTAVPNLRLGIVIIVRNEAAYLEEWLCYHLALGVDHVFLYDNGSTDDTAAVLEPYVNHGLLTLLHWPLPGGQADAYNHALRFFGPSVDWLAFIDVDEFLVPLVDDDLPRLLDRFDDAADIRVPRREFGFSGHRTRPDGLVIEAYTGIADVFGRDPARGPRVKTIARSREMAAIGIHTSTVADAPAAGRDLGDAGDASRETPGRRTARQDVVGLAQLNHYYTRSFEEFEAKRYRGSATGRLARPGVPFELPTLETDTSAHRFIPATRAMLARMRSLAPQPYHYGSHLRFAHFPQANDLGLFAEFCFANLAAGLTEQRREPVLRIPNRYAGIGFVADLADTGFRPGQPEAATSVHMDALLEHVRGRLEAHRTDLAELHGATDLDIPITRDGMRRCFAVGLVATCPDPLRVESWLEHDEGRSGPVRVELPASGVSVALVEVDPRPRFVEHVGVRIAGASGTIVHELFLVSYG